MWKVVQSISGWTDIENPYRLSRGRIYIYFFETFLQFYVYDLRFKAAGLTTFLIEFWTLILYIDVEFLASHFNDLSKFTGWAMIEELSTRRRPRTFLVSWGQKNRVKYCYVDLSSWYGFWFAIICIDMNVILDFSIAIQQFRDGFGCQ